jgi:serine/threonine-protein kinase
MEAGSEDLLGFVLDSKYELGERIGRGGMGTVYLARRLHIGDEVAVKILNPDCRNDELFVERFRREVYVAARACDSRIIAVYDAGETTDGIIYLVMPFIQAPTLREILKAEKRILPERCVSLMLEVCGGVAAAHRQGIMHRDLKPENIMVLAADEDRGRESVRILDFGLAKQLKPAREQLLTQQGVVLGTPCYMSPEQHRGEALDVRSDVYSLGVILYEMLTGRPPFVGYSIAELVAKHLMDAPKPMPAALNIPPALEALVKRALSKDAGRRQADASELAGALRACLKPAPPPRRNRLQEWLSHLHGLF